MQLTVSRRESGHVFGADRRYPLMVERGEGCYVFDTEGKSYLDATGGLAVNALGHCHPRITAVLTAQAQRLVHTSNLVSHPYQGLLAERLCEWSGLKRVFFANSGAEAIEAALKLARFHDRSRRRIVALENSFHGRTMGALSLTGQPVFRAPFAPYADEVRFVAPNDGDALRQAVTEETPAVVLEPVLGEGGVYPLTDEYLRLARTLTSERGALLVADEIQCGLGRTGRRFAYQWAGIQPDIVTLAKPLAAGLPLSAVLMREEVGEKLPAHLFGTTFGGGPLACCVALEALSIIDELIPQAYAVATYLARELETLKPRHPVIRAIRTKGMMFGIELEQPGMAVVEAALGRGLLVNCTHETVLRLLPPLILTEGQAAEIVRMLDETLAEVYGCECRDRYRTGAKNG